MPSSSNIRLRTLAVHLPDGTAGAEVAGLQVGEGRAGVVFQNFHGHEVVAGQKKNTKYSGAEFVNDLFGNTPIYTKLPKKDIWQIQKVDYQFMPP